VAIEITKQLATGHVKVTPDILIQGSSDGAGIVPILSTIFAKRLGDSLGENKSKTETEPGKKTEVEDEKK